SDGVAVLVGGVLAAPAVGLPAAADAPAVPPSDAVMECWQAASSSAARAARTAPDLGRAMGNMGNPFGQSTVMATRAPHRCRVVARSDTAQLCLTTIASRAVHADSLLTGLA